jgi:hypothetical protein
MLIQIAFRFTTIDISYLYCIKNGLTVQGYYYSKPLLADEFEVFYMEFSG